MGVGGREAELLPLSSLILKKPSNTFDFKNYPLALSDLSQEAVITD